MRSLLLLVLLSAPAFADVLVKNAGTPLGPVTAINCGVNTTCSRSGSTATITASGGAGGSGAPVDGGYVVLSGFTSGSTNERTLAAGNYTVIDTGTAGQVQVDWAHGLTCTAGQALTSSGTTALACTSSIATATSCSAADEAANLAVSCVGGEFVTCDGTSCSCATPAGGGGSPGGSTSQLQYNSAGAFAGVAGVESDGTNLRLVATTTHATPGTSPRLTVSAFQHYGSNGPSFLQAAESVLEFDTHLTPWSFTRSDDAFWGCVLAGGSGSATYTTDGRAVVPSATGTAAAVAWAATDEGTRSPRVQHPAAATVNTSAGLRSTVDYVWRGNAAGIGGFLWVGGFRLNLVTATTRVFAGLKDSTAVLTATADPSAALDTLYFGCNAADANLSVCSNDNVGTATCATLGASFPCHTSGAAYDVAFWAPPNNSGVRYWIRRLVTGAEASGTIAADLPRNTVQLGWDLWANTGSTASAVQIHVTGSCWWANP